MSFFTSLTYYRPCEPPTITANDLARFIKEIHDAGVLTDRGLYWLYVRFGESIDQDESPASSAEDADSQMSIMSQIEWDLDLSCADGISEIIDSLSGDNRRVYRARIALGAPVVTVLKPITRTDSPENECDFCPDSISIEVGPIEIYKLGCDFRAFVGWIGISLSGYGYLFPWTFRDVLDRIERSPEIQRIAGLCRSFWPVPLRPIEDRIITVRKELGQLWPYENFARDWDWYWGVQESG